MTLITTEIHPDPSGTSIVFAADRCVLRGQQRLADQTKILWLPRHRIGIGFFGLAEMPTSVGTQRMSEWLWDFCCAVDADGSVDGFAQRLTHRLNEVLSPDWHEYRSGFHLAGFRPSGEVEFWSIQNVNSAGLSLDRFEAVEDYQRRDRRLLRPGEAQIYRNGDIRAHVTAWEALDRAFDGLRTEPDFRPRLTMQDYVDWVGFKLDMIADFYERFSNVPLIGRPIDAFAFSASDYFPLVTNDGD